MLQISFKYFSILTLCLWLGNAEKDFQFENGSDDDLQVMLTEPQKEVESLTPLHKNTYFKELSDCPYTESKIMLSLVLKSTDWDDIVDKKKTRALNKLSKFFAVPKEFIKIESVSRRDISDMSKKSIKRGLYKSDSDKHLGKVEFMIGCGQTYFKIGEPITMQIAQQMIDGSIDDITGLEFGWWVIWKKKIANRVQRFKREEEEGSGQIDPDTEDYEYEYEDGDQSITDIPVETTHAHRHHHGVSKPNSLDSNKKLTYSTQNQPIDTNVIETKTKQHKKNELKPVPESRNELKPPAGPATPIATANDKTANSVIVEDDDIIRGVTKLESQIKKTIENNNNQMETIKKETELISNKISTNQPVVPVTVVDENVKEDTDFEANNEDNDGGDDDYIIEDVNEAPKQTTTQIPIVVPTTMMPTISEDVTLKRIETTGSVKETLASAIPTLMTSPKSTSVEITSRTSVTEKTPPLSTPTTTTTTTSTTISSTTVQQSILITTLPTKTTREETTIAPVTEETITTNIPSTATTTTITTSNSLITTVQSKPASIDVTDSPSTLLVSVVNEKGESEENIAPVATTTTTRNPTVHTTIPNEIDAEADAETTVVALTEPTVPRIVEESPTTTTPTPTTTTQLPVTIPPTTTTTPKATTTTTEPTTEYIEPEPINSPPSIRNRLPKQPVTAGKPFSFIVPDDTFYDREDGANLKLELYDKNGNTLKSNSWIQFKPETKEIYGLPLEDSVSRWQFRMVAVDSKNATVNDSLDLVVQQHKGHRSVNHEISIQVKLNDKFSNNVDWQIRLIRGIVETLGDNSLSNVVVREIRQNQLDPHTATLVYTNETLSKDKCPEDRLDTLIERLDANKLTDSLLPEISVKLVSGQPIGPCQKMPIMKPKPTPHMTKNFPPVPRNQVDRVNATINQLLVFKVPDDTFYDPEDHTDLKLSLLTSDRQPLDPRNWLQFDSKNHEFYGIPKHSDYGSEQYLLVAEDREGQTASDALIVVVNTPSRREYNILTKLTIGMPFDTFNQALVQRHLIERIAQLFGDSSTANIQLKAIQNLNSSGSVMVAFFNTTTYRSYQRCPSDDELEAIRNVWQHPDSTVRERVRKILGNEFNIQNVHVMPTICHGPPTDPPIEVIPKKTEEKKASSFTDDYLFTFIVPAVIILAMLLLASIVACVLHRRRLTGKMELGDEEERRSFRSKGIPVIFQDELDEKPEIGNKSPIILKDEKPPLLPPSYNSDNDVDEYVPPPAVIVGGREQRGKSPVTPSYRKPPPYVSP